jgi:hypothetical protein
MLSKAQWSYDFDPVRALTASERDAMAAGKGIHVKYAPKKNLVSTDNGIITARHRLMRAAKAPAERGVTAALATV